MTPAMLLDGGTQHSHEQAVAMGIHEHSEGEEHADAGSEADHPHADRELADEGQEGAVGNDGHGHGDSMEAGGGHDHSGTELASTLGANDTSAAHEHSGSGTHRDSHGGGAPMDDLSHNENSGGNQHNHSRPEGDQHADDHPGGGHGGGAMAGMVMVAAATATRRLRTARSQSGRPSRASAPSRRAARTSASRKYSRP